MPLVQSGAVRLEVTQTTPTWLAFETWALEISRTFFEYAFHRPQVAELTHRSLAESRLIQQVQHSRGQMHSRVACLRGFRRRRHRQMQKERPQVEEKTHQSLAVHPSTEVRGPDGHRGVRSAHN